MPECAGQKKTQMLPQTRAQLFLFSGGGGVAEIIKMCSVEVSHFLACFSHYLN